MHIPYHVVESYLNALKTAFTMGNIDNFRDSNGEINRENIKKIIPYEDPFLFVDRVLEIQKDKIIAVKDVKADEDFFKGHFVGFPIMPGALMIEGLGQVATLLARYNMDNHEEKDVLAYKIKEVKFKCPVFPGMRIKYDISLIGQDEREALFKGRIFSKDMLIAEALFIVAIVNKNEFRGKYDVHKGS